MDAERKELMSVRASLQDMTSEVTRLKLEAVKRDREYHEKTREAEGLRNEVDRLQLTQHDASRRRTG